MRFHDTTGLYECKTSEFHCRGTKPVADSLSRLLERVWFQQRVMLQISQHLFDGLRRRGLQLRATGGSIDLAPRDCRLAAGHGRDETIAQRNPLMLAVEHAHQQP